MTYDQARKEFLEAKAAGEIAFIVCCFEVAIKQATEAASSEIARGIDKGTQTKVSA